MAKPKNFSRIGGFEVVYILSRFSMMAMSFGLFFLTLSNNTLRVGTLYAKMFSVCNLLVAVFAIMALIYLFMKKKFFRVTGMLGFCSTVFGYGALAISAHQEGIMPMAFLMLALMCLEALWILYIRKSRRIAARVGELGSDGTPLPPPPAAKPQTTARRVSTSEYQEIASIISRGDLAVASRMWHMPADPPAYFAKHEARFARRGIRLGDGDALRMMWLGMADELIQQGYAYEVDWKAEARDVLHGLGLIVKNMGLPVDFSGFAPSPSALRETETALREIGEYVMHYGLVLGALDIESDSYVLFLAGPDAPPMIESRARRIWMGIKKPATKEEAAHIEQKPFFTFAGRDFAKDAQNMPRLDHVGARMAIRAWLIELAESEAVPPDIIAANFALCEPYALELTGAKEYDRADGDWACSEDFVPINRRCPGLSIDSSMPWRQALLGVAQAILDLMAEMPHNSILRIPNVTVGLQDGDLFRIERPKGAGKPDIPDGEIVPPELDYVIREFYEETKLPCLMLEPRQDAASAYDSKLGGLPYLPPGFEYPRETGKDGEASWPLRLLCQLNFSQLPKLPGFPAQGILQFYIAQDDLFGQNFNDCHRQTGFRIVYHKEILPDDSRLQKPPALDPQCADLFPFSGERKLGVRLEYQAMSAADFRFDEAFIAVYRRYFGSDAKVAFDIPPKQYERVWEAFGTGGHRVGGYPYFTQSDPRDSANPSALAGHTALLLQIDSDARENILWGDSGIANFFIAPKMLAALDFSDVVYHWDCY